MKQRFFKVVENNATKTARIDIYGVIGGWWDESNTAKSFQRRFSELEKNHDRIDVYINSPGGSVHEGLPIYNAIRNSSKEVHTYNIGIAYSMGFMILLAAKKGNAHAYKGSLMMAHNVSSLAIGNANDMREEAHVLDKYDDVLASLIADRSGKTVEEVNSLWFDYKDHFFTPEEALSEGFIDDIVNKSAEDVPEDATNMSMGQLVAYYDDQMHEPTDSMMDKIMKRLKSFTGNENSQNKNQNMFGNKFPKMIAMAKVAAADVTASMVADANKEIENAEINGVTLVLDSELEDTTKKVTDLEASVSDKDKKINTLETSVTDKDKEINDLKEEIKALKGKPATEPETPKAEDDTIPGDEGKDKSDEFMTDTDREYQAIYG